jgi:hypothetical protein
MQYQGRGSVKDRSRNAYERSGPNSIASCLAGVDAFASSKELLEAQQFGERVAREVTLWRQVKARRDEGLSVHSEAAQIARRYGVSMDYARMAARLLKGGRA